MCQPARTASEPVASRDPVTPPAATAAPPPDEDRAACRAALARVEEQEPAPGAPDFEAHRIQILGRARGRALLWVDEPAETPDTDLPEAARAARAALSTASPWRRVLQLLRRFRGDKNTLRLLLLRQGYLYSAEPMEALALVERVTLPDLFDESELWLARGERVERLERTTGRQPSYRYATGPDAGQSARLLLGDRVASIRSQLEPPLHRDIQALAHRSGASRIEVESLRREAMVVRLRLGDTWVRARVVSRGARLDVDCVDASLRLRETLAAWRRADAPRRAALANLRAAVRRQVAERLPFDRPRGVQDHLSDGSLRPDWRWAYRAGRLSYEHEDHSYPVFDQGGRPLPPQMCVDFVLESFERAAGTWFRPRGENPERVVGRLDFSRLGLDNRRGVLAFGTFAEEHAELFSFRWMDPEQRVPFGERERFFESLVSLPDLVAPGDVVAIHGPKPDGYVHQHAILVEDVDPMTGFPHALADQMRWPRRRTWEAIMAEAPRRSFYFRARPTPALIEKLVPSSDSPSH